MVIERAVPSSADQRRAEILYGALQDKGVATGGVGAVLKMDTSGSSGRIRPSIRAELTADGEQGIKANRPAFTRRVG